MKYHNRFRVSGITATAFALGLVTLVSGCNKEKGGDPYASYSKEIRTQLVAADNLFYSQKFADAEKAFVDANYLRLISKRSPISRFNKGKINSARALRYAKLFNNTKLIGIIKSTLR